VPGQQVLQGGNDDRAHKHGERVHHSPEEGRASASSYAEPDQGDQGGEEELGALEFRRLGVWRPTEGAGRAQGAADVRMLERVTNQPGSAALVTGSAAPIQRASNSKNRKQMNERPSALGSSSAGVLAAGGGSVTVLMPNPASMNVLMTSCRGRCQ